MNQRATDANPHATNGRRLRDQIRNQLQGALIPILIAAVAFMGKRELDELKTQLTTVASNTQEILVARTHREYSNTRLAAAEQATHSLDRDMRDIQQKQARISEVVSEHSRRLNRLEDRLN